MRVLRVVVADDHPVFRDGLRTMLSDIGADLVAEVGDGAAAVAAVAQHRPDIALLDIRMPILGGVEATARITRDYPATAVLILTMSDEAASLQAALTAGARGYLLKEATKADIERALQAVARGEVVVGAGAAQRIKGLVTGPGQHAFPQLTDRERELLDLMARGLDNTAIAKRLFLAEKTVRNRVSTVLSKLPAATRAEAIAAARDQGLGRPL